MRATSAAGVIMMGAGALIAPLTALNRASYSEQFRSHVACDSIHLYRGDREALTSSLDHIQQAASQILQAIEAGGLGLTNPMATF